MAAQSEIAEKANVAAEAAGRALRAADEAGQVLEQIKHERMVHQQSIEQGVGANQDLLSQNKAAVAEAGQHAQNAFNFAQEANKASE